jgi:hypothetical protein
VFTGSQPTGLASVDRTCANWTSNGEGDGAVGVIGKAWNAGEPAPCSATGEAAPRLYCFAIR